MFDRGILRLMDANANRAREGIRVIEETARMLFDDAELSVRIKHLRHTLNDICSFGKKLSNAMVFARGSDRDVLREVETFSEKTRSDHLAVVRANAARAQEAARALEEYTKLTMPGLSERFKVVRFELYDIEKALLSLFRVKRATAPDRLKCCAVIDSSQLSLSPGTDSLHSLTARIIDAGVASVIFRGVKLSDAEFISSLAAVSDVCAERNAGIFIEHRPDIAMIADADGILLSPGDISAESCRKLMGQQYAIGISTALGDNPAEITNPNADLYVLRSLQEITPDAIKYYAELTSLPVLVYGNFSDEKIRTMFENGIHGIVFIPDYSHPETVPDMLGQLCETIKTFATSTT